MDVRSPAPWHPDRTWADPFILTLALLIIVLVGAGNRARHARPAAPPEQVELQGRLTDLALAAPQVLGALAGKASLPRDPLQGFVDKPLHGWDRAVLAVHAGERGDLALGARLAMDPPGPAGDLFRRAWRLAYQGEGGPLQAGERERLRAALGAGYAAGILEARLTARAGGDPRPLEAQARDWALPRLLALVGAGLGGLLLVLGGLSFMVFLALFPARPQPLARFAMSGRAVLIVLLGWFLTHLAATSVIGLVVALLPFLRPFALPLAYSFHALLGTAFLCLAEGIDLRTLRARVMPAGHGRALASGLGFLALAFTVVLAVAIALSPLLHNAEPPQRELLELLARVRGPLAVGLMFLTVAVLAPAFEELLFRGFLLPWLGERLQPRLGARAGWTAAVFATGLTFAAMHMQPLGLPTLASLGSVLGFAFLRTGNLLTAILVHGIWNGGIFIVMRLLAA